MSDDGVVVWTGSKFAEWDAHMIRAKGWPDFARQATPEEAALYRQRADRIAELEAALAAFHYYVCASDREMSEAGITREGALVRAYKLHDKIFGEVTS